MTPFQPPTTTTLTTHPGAFTFPRPSQQIIKSSDFRIPNGYCSNVCRSSGHWIPWKWQMGLQERSGELKDVALKAGVILRNWRNSQKQFLHSMKSPSFNYTVTHITPLLYCGTARNKRLDLKNNTKKPRNTGTFTKAAWPIHSADKPYSLKVQ